MSHSRVIKKMLVDKHNKEYERLKLRSPEQVRAENEKWLKDAVKNEVKKLKDEFNELLT